MNIRNRVRTLAMGSLAIFTLVGMSVPSVALARPKIDPGIEMDCLLDGDWYAPGEQVTVTAHTPDGKDVDLVITCNGYDGHWYVARSLNPSIRVGTVAPKAVARAGGSAPARHSP
jgi:hypothetical protein